MGFHASLADSSLFIYRENNYLLYLLVYVDDIVITGNSPSFLNILIQQLSHAFELKDLGPFYYFLGLHIIRISRGLYLNQSKYAKDLLQKHNMLSSKVDRTPCAPNLRLVPNEGHFLANPHEHRSLIGSLHYLTFTRPNLSFVVHQVCQFMVVPTNAHLVAVKRFLIYLNGNPTSGIFLQSGPLSLFAFFDSD